MARYIFTRVDPFIEAGSGDRFYFRVEGRPEVDTKQEFYVEEWATENGSGEDFYKVTGERDDEPALGELFNAEDDDSHDALVEEFEQQLQEFKDDWFSLWRQYVEPQIGRAQRDAIKRMERRHQKEDT